MSSCQREPIEVIEYEPPLINPSTHPVVASVMGTVYSEEGLPVAGATVSLYENETMTGDDGVFSFQNATLYSDGTYVSVDIPGYYHASRRFYALAGEINIVGIEMIKKTFEDEFESSVGETLSDINVALDFPAGDYIVSTNDLYTDRVKASIVSIPAGSENCFLKMPGDLTGSDDEFEIKAISNFGIFGVELVGMMGETLDLPSDQSVPFRYKLPDDSQNESSAILWYYEEGNGMWLKSGEVDLENGDYVGEINKTGFWMLGKAYEYADIKGSLIDDGGVFGDTRLDILNDSEKYRSSINTTMSGSYQTRVPQGINLSMSIYHECTVGRQSEDLGVVSSDFEFQPIEVEMAMDNIEILGSITDCQGEHSSRPYLKIDFGAEQYLYRSDEQGDFEFSFSSCQDEEVNIIAIDDENSTTSEALMLPVSNQMQLGAIQTCNPIEAGYSIGYDHMDWSENLESTVIHEWTVSKVSALEEKVIFSAKMFDESDGTLFLTAAFVFIDGEAEADYQLNFKTQGFIMSGSCVMNEVAHDGISSFRFQGSNDEVTSTGNGVFPGDVGTVQFNLVYYD